MNLIVWCILCFLMGSGAAELTKGLSGSKALDIVAGLVLALGVGVYAIANFVTL